MVAVLGGSWVAGSGRQPRWATATEKEPDRVEVVEVGFDSPVAPNLRAEALAADAGTTIRDLEQELDPLLANHPNKTFIGADQVDGDHERTVITRVRARPGPYGDHPIRPPNDPLARI